MKLPTDEQKKQIHDDIFKKTEKALQRAGFSRDKIARELVKIAFSDIQDYLQIDEQGSVKALSIDAMKSGSTKAIKKIREKRRILNTKDENNIILEDVFEFELYDKLDALKTVAAMLGMEKPKEVKHIGEIEHNHNHGVTPEIKEILDAFLEGRRG